MDDPMMMDPMMDDLMLGDELGMDGLPPLPAAPKLQMPMKITGGDVETMKAIAGCMQKKAAAHMNQKKVADVAAKQAKENAVAKEEIKKMEEKVKKEKDAVEAEGKDAEEKAKSACEKKESDSKAKKVEED